MPAEQHQPAVIRLVKERLDRSNMWLVEKK